MDMRETDKVRFFYTALFERGSDGYYVSFPDLPGCVSAGDTLQDAAGNAEVALALHISGMIDDGEMLPVPTSAENIPVDPEVTEVARMLIGIDPEANTKMRVNVMLDRALLSAIDSVSGNRSRFLSDAARDKLRALSS
jgi:predicted RNase H-like HicB family nuclease